MQLALFDLGPTTTNPDADRDAGIREKVEAETPANDDYTPDFPGDE